jgi:hypothetical protein
MGAAGTHTPVFCEDSRARPSPQSTLKTDGNGTLPSLVVAAAIFRCLVLQGSGGQGEHEGGQGVTNL